MGMPAIEEKGRLRKISVDEVEVGMYCRDVYNQHNVLVLSAQIPISTPDQVAQLKKLGVKYVEIDLTKGKDLNAAAPPPVPAAAAPSSEVPLEEEIPRAREVYARTLTAARDALRSIKLGQELPVEQIQKTVEEIMGSIMRNSDALMSLLQIKGHDEYTFEHSVNVAILVCSSCHAMGFGRPIIMEGCIGGLLHDIGKTWIPEHIINKPGKFDAGEFSIMKRHPEYGAEIVKGRKGISDIAKQVILQHHERINGKGYPRGLRGDQIHALGCLAGLADVYDAMTSARVYRPAFTPQQALATIYSGIGDEFPQTMAEQFIKFLGVYPAGSFVLLRSGEMGIVTRVNRENLLNPDVLVLISASGGRLPAPAVYRLADMVGDKGGERFAIEKSLNPAVFGIDVADYLKGKDSSL